MSEIRTTSRTGGEKGVKPERHSLLPREGLDEVARVYGFGAQKYDDHNWRKGYEWSKSYDAMQRHLSAWWAGEDTDPESGLSHLGHAGFHVLTLLTFEAHERYAEFDDRYVEEAERDDSFVRAFNPETQGVEFTLTDMSRETIALALGMNVEDLEVTPHVEWRDPEVPTQAAVKEAVANLSEESGVPADLLEGATTSAEALAEEERSYTWPEIARQILGEAVLHAAEEERSYTWPENGRLVLGDAILHAVDQPLADYSIDLDGVVTKVERDFSRGFAYDW